MRDSNLHRPAYRSSGLHYAIEGIEGDADIAVPGVAQGDSERSQYGTAEYRSRSPKGVGGCERRMPRDN